MLEEHCAPPLKGKLQYTNTPVETTVPADVDAGDAMHSLASGEAKEAEGGGGAGGPDR